MGERGEAEPREIGWCVLEVMGHRRLVGYVREDVIAGAGFLRIDIPGDGDAPMATQYYSPASVFAMTPTTEEFARAEAARARPSPPSRLSLGAPDRALDTGGDDAFDDDEEDADLPF